ncbi:MaoC family dehydratase [Pallidibacillus pasinlerensis]|uniref:MaoC family dehydratase n=1 Tax=Pallidibacillus pasinlerensis TaxID=2703818 RepID=A0ABX0A1X0_9BACI|nr:MaoC family dehydratase [Pallidibacillus pasinlerensis]NCU16817.1 MaoC family dehydratase [Pallidibacillus pasinlerensis]
MPGKYFEELHIGDVFKHEITRTVTETDNLLFTTMTHNPQPLHLDAEFGKNSIHGSIIVNSMFTAALIVGISVGDTTLGTTLGNLGFEEMKFPNPVRIGDTLRVETEVINKRESKSKPDRGIVWFEHRGYNQRDELVAQMTRLAMMKRKDT